MDLMTSNKQEVLQLANIDLAPTPSLVLKKKFVRASGIDLKLSNWSLLLTARKCCFADIAAGIIVSKIDTATASFEEMKQYLA